MQQKKVGRLFAYTVAPCPRRACPVICTLLVQCWNSFNIEVMQLTHSFVAQKSLQESTSVPMRYCTCLKPVRRFEAVYLNWCTWTCAEDKSKAALQKSEKNQMICSQLECLELCVTEENVIEAIEAFDQYITINDIPAEARAMIAAWEARPPHEQRFQSHGCSGPSMSTTNTTCPVPRRGFAREM